MRVLVAGASGLIGSHVARHLAAEGHVVIGAGRRIAAAEARLPGLAWRQADVGRLTRPEAWRPVLADVEAVVNCVGVLQDGFGDSLDLVHVAGTGALFEACERFGVRRVIHLSAAGVAADAETAFARTKHAADAGLMARDLDWIILRPVIVAARDVYGGTALLRGLAGLDPLTPLPRGGGALQVVAADDVAATAAALLRPGAPARLVLDLGGPENHSLESLVLRLRLWLGFGPARILRVPAALGRIAARCGDGLARLGWRPPLRSTALRYLTAGVTADSSAWTAATGIAPRPLAAILAEPATVQDRWFARLFLLKPAVIGALALFWIGTGLATLGPGRAAGTALLAEAGLGAAAGGAAVAGALLDLGLGLMLLWRPLARPALQAMLVVSAAYLLAITVLLPRLWADPLAAALKILPVMALTGVALAILDDR